MEGHRRGRARVATVAAFLAVAVVTGCSSTGGTMDPREQLAQRPTFEQAEERYLSLLRELRTIVDERQSGLQWQEAEPVRTDRSGCGEPFDRVDGAKNANYTFDGAVGAVEDANWGPTLEAMKGPLAAQGFTEVTVLQDEPGAHEVSVGDPSTGARVVFGTKTGTVLTLYGGCFLLADRG